MCWYCGSPVNYDGPIGRSLVCPDCGKDLRCCGNCRHFLRAEKSCAEPQGENPADRERANFCDWFSLNPKFKTATAGEKSAAKAADAAKAAFNNLFK
ncbi:MAG: hypothetical protein FWD78_03130 [Treponema sp.]|nr:hypothetical protein [Treponema sp.]